jgi:glycosyltransferase involved in cell wall biosynthesis
VVPTRNEAANVGLLVSEVATALGGAVSWEILFVDDSDDATPEAVGELRDSGYPVRLLHREPGQRTAGLGGAVTDGFAHALGRVIAVMDADLQHPPDVVPALVAEVLAGRAELVVGNRYGPDGTTRGLAGPWRRLVSWTSRMLVHSFVARSRCVDDPMSGLFAFDRCVIEGVTLRPDGFKILLDILVRGRWASVANIGYVFADRHAGVSKASLHEGLVFFRHLACLLFGTEGTAPHDGDSGGQLAGSYAGRDKTHLI